MVAMSSLGYFTFVILGLSFASATEMSNEKRLIKHMLSNYDRIGRVGRPVMNASDPIKVNISFGLIELEKFDIPKQQLVMVGWTAMEWDDSLLQWDSADFGNLEQIALKPDDIWLPDVIVTNSVSKPDPIQEPHAHVTNEGKVTWVSKYRYHFYCMIATEDMDADTFPCYIKFGSWSMSSSSLQLSNKRDRFDAKYLITNREWEFFRNKAKKQEVELPWGNTMKSSEVTYDFTLKRRVEENTEEDLDNSASVGHLSPALMLLAVLCRYVILRL